MRGAGLRPEGEGVLKLRIGLVGACLALSACCLSLVDVTIQGSSYLPATVTIDPGETVRWTNKDFLQHTVTSTSGVFDSGFLSMNQQFSYTFNDPGTYDYICMVHPFMAGKVIVRGEALVADAARVIFGSIVSGTFADTHQSDDVHFVIQNGSTFLITQSPITVELDSVTTMPSPTVMRIELEGRVSLANLMLRMDMMDFDTNSFQQVFEGPAPIGSDQVRTGQSGGQQFVRDSDLLVRARVRVKDDSPAFLASWTLLMDRFRWIVY
jgi:hypothetical protein